MAFQLRCTVRGCQNVLVQNERGLTCDAGHHFDQAKEGYWSLLQPQDRKSKNPGDAESAVLARHRWLQRGHHVGLVDALQPWVAGLNQSASGSVPRTLDLGCGEGSFGLALFSDEPDGYCGIDLSKRAIKIASRGWPSATWVLANADRCLPVADGSVDRVISLFGRRPIAEIGRVLSSAGICIVAVPGEEDLIELREQAQQSGRRRRRWETVLNEFAQAGLKCTEHKQWKHQVSLQPDAVVDAMAMTYRAVRRSEASRLESIKSTISVTLSADLIMIRR
jgi:23S rRNA (guanine745-N1)-methyltransferase